MAKHICDEYKNNCNLCPVSDCNGEFTAERGTLLYAVQAAYRKHHLDDDRIGWDELGNILLDALCNQMGDGGYQAWLERVARKETP